MVSFCHIGNIVSKRMSENNQTTSEQSAPLVTRPKQKNAFLKWVVVAVLALALIAVVAIYKFDLLGGGVAPDDTSANALDANAIVAKSEKITVTRGELDEKIDQVRRSLPPDAVDPTQDAAFELQLLDDLISLKLLTVEAEAKNYTVSDDELNAEITLLVEQFGGQEALNQQLEALGISDEELRTNMRNELLIRQLLEAETTIDEVEVTDAEIAEAYKSTVGEAEDAPPLEQVTELIRSEIVNQKSAGIVQAYVDGLRDQAQVEVTLK
ncbi:MAG: Foldase protein PrsA [Parcubacteria group bacterium GW2011_GWA2_43_11]|nr:MAG: Foldase protein PrsA [Parcubacteria group bacterium GW2011_GWC2_42_11]KKS84709.1 MAG: Foldase protein PrsA [Parcubacteria group bacterium GW2011_GWA2_43_11]